jgi:hypothetical protein
MTIVIIDSSKSKDKQLFEKVIIVALQHHKPLNSEKERKDI